MNNSYIKKKKKKTIYPSFKKTVFELFFIGQRLKKKNMFKHKKKTFFIMFPTLTVSRVKHNKYNSTSLIIRHVTYFLEYID